MIIADGLRSHRAGFRQGISRFEIIAVLGTLAVIVALILPAIQQSREAARRSTCKNNLKQFGIALHNYHDTYESFPPGAIGNPELPPDKRWSWYLCMGNYWGHYGEPIIDLDAAWDDPALRPLQLHTWVNGDFKEFDTELWAYPILFCPSGCNRKHTDGQPFTDYVGLGGVGEVGPILPRSSPLAGMWAYEMTTRLEDVADDPSHTLMMMETARDNGCWLAGGPASVRAFDPDGLDAIGTTGQFGGIHPGGGMALWVDGRVEFLSDNIDHKVFAAAVTIAGNEDEP